MKLARILGVCLLALPLAAHADTVFNISNGTTGSYYAATFSGTVTIDTSTGVIDSANVTYTSTAHNGGMFHFTGVPSSQSQDTHNGTGYTAVFLATDLTSRLLLEIDDAPTNSLVGYAGGPLCSVADTCGGNVGESFSPARTTFLPETSFRLWRRRLSRQAFPFSAPAC